jgi:hypothetical protein
LLDDADTVRVIPSLEQIQEYLARPWHKRPLVEIVHDESTFYANEEEIGEWVEAGGTCKLRRKSRGASLMLSVFICELQGGVLTAPDGRRAISVLEAGKGVWWTSDRMLAQLKEVVKIGEAAFPWARLVFRSHSVSDSPSVV